MYTVCCALIDFAGLVVAWIAGLLGRFAVRRMPRMLILLDVPGRDRPLASICSFQQKHVARLLTEKNSSSLTNSCILDPLRPPLFPVGAAYLLSPLAKQRTRINLKPVLAELLVVLKQADNDLHEITIKSCT